MRKIITVSREFGSGGREIAKRLSEILNIAYIDSEIVRRMAEETNLNEDYLNNVLEKGINKLTYARSFTNIAHNSNSAMLIAKQHNIIRQIAQKDDCVIVGRGADAILASYNPFRIFVYADMASKTERCKSRMAEGETLSDKEIIRTIKSIDKARKNTHDLYANYGWGDKEGYNLCINTAGIEIKKIVPLIADYIKIYFNEENTDFRPL